MSTAATQPLSHRKLKGSAWRKPEVFKLPPAPAPTRWELLLRELEISEQYAAMAIDGLIDAPRITGALRNFVMRYSGYYFIPETVLRSVGVQVLLNEHLPALMLDLATARREKRKAARLELGPCPE